MNSDLGHSIYNQVGNSSYRPNCYGAWALWIKAENYIINSMFPKAPSLYLSAYHRYHILYRKYSMHHTPNLTSYCWAYFVGTEVQWIIITSLTQICRRRSWDQHYFYTSSIVSEMKKPKNAVSFFFLFLQFPVVATPPIRERVLLVENPGCRKFIFNIFFHHMLLLITLPHFAMDLVIRTTSRLHGTARTRQSAYHVITRDVLGSSWTKWRRVMFFFNFF